MKNIRKIFILFLIFLFLFLNFTNFVYADETEISEYDISVISETSEEIPTIVETKKHDLFLCENSVNINYPVSGNVFIIGNEVTIDSSIDGNVFVLANDVTVTGNASITTDLFVCAKNVTISGIVYDLYAMTNNLDITTAGFIIRDLNSTCDNFSLAGEIKRNANVAFDTITISENTAQIYGNLTYYSSDEVTINEDIIAGSITRSDSQDLSNSENSTVMSTIVDLLLSLLYGIIIVLVIVFAMTKFSNKLDNILTTKLLPVIGFGAIGLIVVPIISVILCCTGIGVWFGLALMFVYLFIVSISGAVLALSLSKLICSRINKTSNTMVISISALIILVKCLLTLIPYVSTIVVIVKTIFGFGIILHSLSKNN